jgi:hypothetical protein
MGWTTRRSGFDPRRGQRIFPLASVFRPALGPTQPPVQWVPGGPFPGAKARPGRDADHSPQSSAEVVNEKELYLLSPQAPPWRVAGLLYLYIFRCAAQTTDNWIMHQATKSKPSTATGEIAWRYSTTVDFDAYRMSLSDIFKSDIAVFPVWKLQILMHAVSVSNICRV